MKSPTNIPGVVCLSGEFHFAVAKLLELTSRRGVSYEADYDTNAHWGPSYLVTRNLSLLVQWHSRFGWGGGLGWQF